MSLSKEAPQASGPWPWVSPVSWGDGPCTGTSLLPALSRPTLPLCHRLALSAPQHPSSRPGGAGFSGGRSVNTMVGGVTCKGFVPVGFPTKRGAADLAMSVPFTCSVPRSCPADGLSVGRGLSEGWGPPMALQSRSRGGRGLQPNFGPCCFHCNRGTTPAMSLRGRRRLCQEPQRGRHEARRAPLAPRRPPFTRSET